MKVYNGTLGAGLGHRFDRIAHADPPAFAKGQFPDRPARKPATSSKRNRTGTVARVLTEPERAAREHGRECITEQKASNDENLRV